MKYTVNGNSKKSVHRPSFKISLLLVIVIFWILSLLTITIVRNKIETARGEPRKDFRSSALLLHIKDISEHLPRCPQQRDVCTISKSDKTIGSH